MSMKFFSNIQDFLHLYTPSAMVPNISSPAEEMPSSSSSPSASFSSHDQQQQSMNGTRSMANESIENFVVVNGTDFEHEDDKSCPTYARDARSGILRKSASNSNISNGEVKTLEAGDSSSNLDISTSTTSEEPKKRKSVQFPVDDNLVTGFLEPRKPSLLRRKISSEDGSFLNLHEMLEAYLNACKKFKVTPIGKIEKQISTFHMVRGERQEILTLRGEKLTHAHMDCLEEIFKRVQFNTLDFEYCFLDDEAIISLSDMLEFYDSTIRLNLSFNQNVGVRGWNAFFRMLRKSPCLEHLNLRYTSLNERTVPLLARTLRTESSLVSLHLENCSLSGKSMLLLACAFKTNSSIRDLYLAENNLTHNDASHLYQIILANTSIELLDLRNNQLQDVGLSHICDALRNPESQAKSKLNTLVLWNNRLTSHGMVHLARALLENKTLKTLNLGSNNIGSDGVSIIKDALARNRTLLRLGLQATKLNCQGAIAMAECIADNSVLIRVDLRDNPEIKSAGLLALHVALRMNTSILALNLDKTCVNASSMKSKEHIDHFKKLFDEIHTFCRRNHDLMMEKLKEAESRVRTPEDECCAEGEVGERAERPLDEDEVPEIAPEIVAEAVADCPEIAPRLNLNARKISLTCKESVDNIWERFVSMPRLDEASEENNNKQLTVEVREMSPVFEEKSQTVPCASSNTDSKADNVAPVVEVKLLQPQARPSSLPVKAAAVSPRQRRFSVSKVDAMKKATDDSCTTVHQSPARRSTIDCVPEKENENFLVIRRLVSDMVNFCAYEAGELANTPCVPAHQHFLHDFMEKKTEEEACTSNKCVEVKKEDNVVVDAAMYIEVNQLLGDLVRFVEYDAEGSTNDRISTQPLVKKKQPKILCIDRSVANENGGEDFEQEKEIALAVREVMRDLLKSVSVERKTSSRCLPFLNATAARSSLRLANNNSTKGECKKNVSCNLNRQSLDHSDVER